MAKDYANNRYQRNRPRRKVKRGNISPWIVAGILIGIFIAGLLYFKMKHAHMFNQQVIENSQLEQAAPKKAPPSTKVPEPHFDFYSVLPKDEKAVASDIANSANKKVKVNPAELLPDVPVEEVILSEKPEQSKIQTNQTETKSNKLSEPPVTTVDIGESVQADRNQVLAEEKRRMEQELANASQQSLHKGKNTNTADFAKHYILLLGAFKDRNKAEELRAQFVLQGFNVNVKPVKKEGQTLYRLWMGPFSLKVAQQQQQHLQVEQIKSVLTKA